MIFFKKLIKIVVVILVLIIVGVWLYSKTYSPHYNGEIELKNLSEEVTVYFDDIGVPHINAQNQNDAYTALGYVHAQDRLWQMELIRRIAAGRLSEIFGEKLIQTIIRRSRNLTENGASKGIPNQSKLKTLELLGQVFCRFWSGFTNMTFWMNLGVSKNR